MEMNAKTIVSGIVAAVGTITLILWGVPYYIKSAVNDQVEARMNELAIDPASAPAVVANTTKLESLSEGQQRIEGKVDKFSSEFLRYLERQAQ